MRSKKSMKNIVVAMANNIINIIISLFAQKVFLSTLGEKYLGLNGIFVNVLSLLAIAELGIGTAIIFKLYKPVEDNNQEEIKKLMKFYKKCYSIIISVMAIIVIAIMPFLKTLIGSLDGITENVYILYLLFSIDIIISYMLSYKRSILYADQKEYVSSLVHIGYLMLLNTLQIIFLIFTKNYIVYLLIKIIMRVLENIVISIIVNKKYPYLLIKDNLELDKKEKNDIIKRIKALFVHKIAGFIVTGTDTLLISYFLGGLVTVGYYTNYNLIISSVTTVFNQIFISMTSSVGNLLVTEKPKKTLEVFKRMQFLNFWLFTFASICLFCLIEPFITIWIGEKYILPKLVLISLVLNFYFQGMRRTMMAFKEAAGIFYEDRFVPIVESIINLVASIVLLKLFGLAGVFMGTICSTMIVYLYSYPKYVYKKLFNKNGINYILDILKYLIISVCLLIITYMFTKILIVNNSLLQLVVNSILCLTIPNIILYFIYRKKDVFNYYLELLKDFKRRKNEK